MPYKHIFVEPELFMEYKGVKIYFVYKDDDIDMWTREFEYGLSIYSSENDPDSIFSVYDISFWDEEKYYSSKDREGYIKEVIKKAIDSGILDQSGLKEYITLD